MRILSVNRADNLKNNNKSFIIPNIDNKSKRMPSPAKSSGPIVDRNKSFLY